MRTLLLAFLVLVAASVNAEVYKWVDEKGVVHYTDQPPTQNAKPASLPPLQTYKEGPKPELGNLDEPDNSARQSAAAPALKIISPAPEQTFRGEAQRQVTVSVQSNPALEEGQFLIYRLNGADRSGPTPETSFTLTGVERGAHTVSVSLVNAAGRELARSEAVTVHMKPPIVKN